MATYDGNKDLLKVITEVVDDLNFTLNAAGHSTKRTALNAASTTSERLETILPAQIKAWKNRHPPVIPPEESASINLYFYQYGFMTKATDGTASWTPFADEIFTAMGFEQVPPPEPEA